MIEFTESINQNNKSTTLKIRNFNVVEDGLAVATGTLNFRDDKIIIQLNCKWDGDSGIYDFLLRSLLNVVRDIPDEVCVLDAEGDKHDNKADYLSKFGFVKNEVATKDICFTTRCKK